MAGRTVDRSEALRTIISPVAFLALVTTVLLIIYAQSLLIPLAIAILIWFLLNALMAAFGRISVGRWQPPQWLRLLFSMLIVVAGIVFTVEVISTTIGSMSSKAPNYQANVKKLLDNLSQALGLEHLPVTSDILKEIDIGTWVGAILTALSNLAGQVGIIFIYVLFLLIDQRSFDKKIGVLFPDPERQAKVRGLLEKMATQIRTYLLIKTGMAILSGLVAYVVMVAVGLDFAAFWAFFTVLTYYIPTIGSLLALVFPVAFAVVQFDTFVPALIILVVSGGLQTVIGNVLEPRLMGRSLNLSAFVLIVSLFVWGAIWGVAGMFLCVPITVILMIICSSFERTRPIAVILSSDGELD